MAVRPKPVVPIEDKSSTTLMMNLMLGALRTGDETLEATAAELLVRWGQEPLRRLVLTAADRANTTKYRVRLLELVRRIGVISDIIVLSDITLLSRIDKDPEVRNAAAQVLANLRMA